MEDEELLPPPPKKVSNEVEEDFLLPPPPKKKLATLPNFATTVEDATKFVPTPLKSQSPLVSNLKSVSEKKEKQINPFTASRQELEATYGKDYNKQENLNRQKNYTQGLEKLSKRVDSLIPQYETKVSELDQLDAQLEQLKQDPNAYKQAIQVRNQKVGEVVKLADSLRAEKEKADIYEKGLSAVDVLRRSNEDTFTNRTNAAFNTLGIMGTTMLPTIARGVKVIDSYLQSKAMGLNEQEAELYQKAQTEITKKNWKGLTDVAREFYDKNQILEGGFSKESGYEKIKEGDYKAAGTLLAKELVQNLPVTLGIGASFVNPLLGASFTIGGTAGAELQDMDINSPQMSEQAKIANAFVKGGSEYVTEKIFGTFNYLGRIAGGSIKSQAGKKMLLGSVKEAYEQVAKRFGLGADVIEEVSTEMLNKIVGDYTDYTSGKTSELDFKKGLGETITTALSTSLLLGGAGRAAKYGSKKIDELRAKAKQLQTTIEDPSIKPEIANAVKEEVLNINQQIGDEAAKSKATYDALPEEKQDRVDALVEEKTATENILKDPQLPQEIKPSIEEKLTTIQSEIDNEYKSVDKSLIKAEESKLEEIAQNKPIETIEKSLIEQNVTNKPENLPLNEQETEISEVEKETPKENKTTTTPSSSNNSEVSAPSVVKNPFKDKSKQEFINDRLNQIQEIRKRIEGTSEEKKKRYDKLLSELGNGEKAIKQMMKEDSDNIKSEIDKLPKIPQTDVEIQQKKGEELYNKAFSDLGFKDSEKQWGDNVNPFGEDMGDVLQNETKDTAIFIKPNIEEVEDTQNDNNIEEITNGIKIELLSTKPNERGKGKARQLLKKMIKWADENNATLFLDIAPQDESTTIEGLKKLYESEGFVFNGIEGKRKPIPTSNKGTQTAEPTIKESEEKIKSEKVFTYDKEGNIIEATVISKGKDTTSILVNGKQTVRANTEIFSNKKEAEDRIAKEIVEPQDQKRSEKVDFTAKSGNKAVDEKGEPITVYHGTGEDFKDLDETKQNSVTGHGDFGKGFYFTAKEGIAKYYSLKFKNRIIKKFNINVKKPFEINIKDEVFDEETKKSLRGLKYIQDYEKDIIRKATDGDVDFGYKKITKEIGDKRFSDILKENGYDAVFVNRTLGGETTLKAEIVVFDKSQIKEQSTSNKEQAETTENQVVADNNGQKTENKEEIVDPEIQRRDNLVNDLSTYNKLTKAAKASSKGVKMLNGIKTRVTEMGFTTQENKGKLEVINVNGKRLTKSRTTEEVTEPTQEARDNFKKLFKEGVIVPSIVSQTLEPTQIRVAIEAFKKGKETKDVKRLMNEFSDFNEDTDVKYREWDGNKWVGFSVPLSDMLTQEVDVDNLTEKEINELADIYDDMFADIDEETQTQLTNLFYEEQETRQQDQSEDSTSSKSSTKAKGTKTSEKVVKAVEKILENELESNGSLSKSAVIRTQKRNTAVKQVKSELDTKEAKAVETVIANYDKIRNILIDEKLIKAIDCKWAR